MSAIWLLTNFISSIWQYVLADLELSGQVVHVLTGHYLLNGHQFVSGSAQHALMERRWNHFIIFHVSLRFQGCVPRVGSVLASTAKFSLTEPSALGKGITLYIIHYIFCRVDIVQRLVTSVGRACDF